MQIYCSVMEKLIQIYVFTDMTRCSQHTVPRKCIIKPHTHQCMFICSTLRNQSLEHVPLSIYCPSIPNPSLIVCSAEIKMGPLSIFSLQRTYVLNFISWREASPNTQPSGGFVAKCLQGDTSLWLVVHTRPWILRGFQQHSNFSVVQ